MLAPRREIAIDGHDAAGKSTLAALLAEACGGEVVAPFSIPVGHLCVWLSQNGMSHSAAIVGRAALVWAAEQHGDPIVYDRHWLSLLTLLPPEYHHLVPRTATTVVCAADLDTTMTRLTERDGCSRDRDEEGRNAARYRTAAERENVPIVDTSEHNPATGLAAVLRALVGQDEPHPGPSG